MATKSKLTVGQFFRIYGVKLFTDIFLLVGVTLIIIGLIIGITGNTTGTHNIVMLVGLFFVLAASAAGAVYDVMILKSKLNKRSPRYRSALVNLYVLAGIFAAALFGVIYTCAALL